MTLRNEIIEIEEEMARMLTHLRELRLRVDALEVQNSRLRERITAEKVASEGQVALRSLYEEGFHICPAHFGENRNNEACLFCIGFLQENAGA